MPAATLSSSSAATATPTPHSLLPFLQSQPQTVLSRLYQRPSSCLSIFRLLDALARQLVLSLLWLDGPVSLHTLTAWITHDGTQAFDDAIAVLAQLHIVPNPSSKLTLSSAFKTSMRHAITGGGTSASFGVPAEHDDRRPPPTVTALDAYALERWETILHYMVSSGTGQTPSRPSPGVLFLLQRSGLMAPNHGSTLQITSAGFQFLLHTPHEQLWQLLLQYLQMAGEREMDLVEVLSFLFMLSTTDLGLEYSTEPLSPTQQAMLEDLRDYGLLWQRKPSSKRFSPTRLATTLTSSLPPLPTATSSASSNTAAAASGSGATAEGFIVLETNYRLYAYTNNPLQTAVLNLFVTMKSRFPNLVVGAVTRDSVRRALANGITAEQIISYLTTYAHPQMRKSVPLLPVTVQDQIRLWELERNRIQTTPGFLYTDFASHADYEIVRAYAAQLGLVVWESAARRCFFGRPEGHEVVKQFIARKARERGVGAEEG